MKKKSFLEHCMGCYTSNNPHTRFNTKSLIRKRIHHKHLTVLQLKYSEFEYFVHVKILFKNLSLGKPMTDESASPAHVDQKL